MVKKGLGIDEKKQIILNVFHEQKVPLTLKDVEKLGSKAGVVQQTIKDVLASLVDDSLVEMDKIGATNWYWSFPSQQISKRIGLISTLEARQQELTKKIKALMDKKTELEKDRKPTPARAKALEELEKHQQRFNELSTKFEMCKASDPARTLKLQQAVKVAQESANRWTDNTWTLADYMKKKYGVSRQDVQKQLQMSNDFDYPVYKPPAKTSLEPSVKKQKINHAPLLDEE